MGFAMLRRHLQNVEQKVAEEKKATKKPTTKKVKK